MNHYWQALLEKFLRSGARAKRNGRHKVRPTLEFLEDRTLLTTYPFVQSITRTTPASPSTNLATVSYTVTFNEAVTGVASADFALALSGSVAASTITVTPTSGSVYTVTVTGISGSGTLGLNLVDNGNIRDLAGDPLYSPNSSASFQNQQSFGPFGEAYSLAVGDVNGDGFPDLAVANAGSGTVSVLLGNGNGTFQPQQLAFATGRYPFSVAMADLNGDGLPDLVTANYGSNTVSVLLGTGSGSFQLQQTFATGAAPSSVALADVTGDGIPDILVTNFKNSDVSVLLGNGNGTFQTQQTFATGTFPTSVAVGDVNGDGNPDLAVADAGYGAVSVLLGNGNGTFQAQQPFAAGGETFAVAMGDVNGDGFPDLAVTNFSSNTVSVLLGNGDGTFQTQQTFATGSHPLSLAIGDVNGDGKPDLTVSNNGSNTVSLLVGNGNGTFQSQLTAPTGTAPGSVLLADMNGDGKPDIVVANHGSSSASSTVSIFFNNDNGSFTGQVYNIQQVFPFVQSIIGTNPAGPSTNATTVTYTVTFNEAVTGVTAADFQLALGGTVSGTIGQVTPVSGSVYTVTVNGITGNGTLGLNLVDNGIIHDLFGNPLTQQSGLAAFQTQKSFSVAGKPNSVAVGDLNGDGKADLAVATGGADLGVLLGNGNGTFQAQQTFTTNIFSDSVTMGDVNGDGKPDLVSADDFDATVSVLAGNGDGTFQGQLAFATGSAALSQYAPYSVNLADLNGDGRPDITVANFGDNTVSVLLGLGDGGFQAAQIFATGSDPKSVAVGDVNGDGIPDLVVANSGSNTVSVLLGNGNGTFQAQQTFAVGSEPLSVALADLNGDGDLDIAVANSKTSTVSVLLGNGNGTFQAQQTFATGNLAATQTPSSVAVGDINGDGLPDLVVANAGTNTVGILFGNGNGTFQAPQSFATMQNPVSVALGSFTGDGKLDIAVANELSPAVSVLLNAETGNFTGQVYTIGSLASTHFAFTGLPSASPAGASLTFTVTALNQSNNPVTNFSGTIHFTSTDAKAVLPANATLANGVGIFTATLKTAGNQTITATDTLTGAFSGSSSAVTVSAAAASQLAITGSPSSVTAGGVIPFTVTALDPFGNIAASYSGTVNFTSSDANATLPANSVLQAGTGVFSATLTTAGTQTITAVDTLTSSIAATSAAITVNPAAVNHFAISAPGSATLGAAFTFTVVAQDQYYNTALGYTGTVHFISSDKSAKLQANAPLTNGTGIFSATLNTPGSQTITAYDTVSNTITGRSGPVAVNGAATHFLVSAPASTTAGSPFEFVVTALDAQGNPVASYSGIVHLSSSDSQALLPANATLIGGVGFFAAALKTAGNQKIVATDTVTGGISGTSAAIAVTALAATHLAVGAPATAITGSPINVTVTALDPFNNVATGYSGTVHFTSSDPSAVLPANTALTAGLAVLTVTLKSPGSQTITAADISAPTITGTSNSIASVGLTVTSFTPTATGFVAVFDKPFDPTQINLYDTSGTYGADDVLLTGPGAPLTSFHGSLIIDPTNTTITFVKTSDFNGINFNPSTGVLAPGTYTATLRSASNGFKDVIGGLLDGTGTGNSPGTNYTTTFVVGATPAVVGIPAFARGPDSVDAINLPNNVAGSGIPINLSAGAGVTSGQFTLQYNPSFLSISGATVNPALAGATLSLDPTSTLGNAVIDFSTTATLSSGIVHLGSLVATMPNSAAPSYTLKSLLHFSSVQLNGGAIKALGDDAVQVVAYLGDVSAEGQLNGLDAALISRVSAGFDNNTANGIIGGFSAYRLADPAIVGDLNNSGSVDSSDVTLINSFNSGTTRPQFPATPKGLSIPTNGPDPSLSLPATLDASPGGTVVVPVNIDTARPDGSTGLTEAILALRFDPQVFNVSSADVQLGSLTRTAGGWQITTVVNSQTGEIGIDLFSTIPIQTTVGGSLVIITMQVRDSAPPVTSGLTLVTAVNPGGQRVFRTEVADSQGPLALHPGDLAPGKSTWNIGAVEDVGRGLAASTLPASFDTSAKDPVVDLVFRQMWEMADLPQLVAANPLLADLAFNDLTPADQMMQATPLGQPATVLASDLATAGQDSVLIESAWVLIKVDAPLF